MSKVNLKQLSDINDLTEKTTLHDDDLVLIEDSEDSYNKKKVKKSNLTVTTMPPTFNSKTVGTQQNPNHVIGRDSDGNIYMINNSTLTDNVDYLIKYSSNLDIVGELQFKETVRFESGCIAGEHAYIATRTGIISKIKISDMSVVSTVTMTLDTYIKDIKADSTYIYIGGRSLTKLNQSDLSLVSSVSLDGDIIRRMILVGTDIYCVGMTGYFVAKFTNTLSLTVSIDNISNVYDIAFWNNRFWFSVTGGTGTGRKVYSTNTSLSDIKSVNTLRNCIIYTDDTYLWIDGNAYDTSYNFVKGYEYKCQRTSAIDHYFNSVEGLAVTAGGAQAISNDYLFHDNFLIGRWSWYPSGKETSGGYSLSKINIDITGTNSYTSTPKGFTLTGVTGVSNITDSADPVGSGSITVTTQTPVISNTTLSSAVNYYATYFGALTTNA